MTDQEFTKKLARALEDAAFVEHHDTPCADPDTLSPAVRRRLRRILRDPLGCARAHERPLWLRAARTAAMAALALLTCLGTLMAVPTTRAYVEKIAMQWNNDMFIIDITAGEDDETVYDSTQWRLASFPEGYTENVRDSSLAELYIRYEHTKRPPINFTVRSVTADYEFGFLSLYTTPKTITINGHDAYVFEPEKSGFTANNLVWFDEEQQYVFHLSSKIPMDELIEMAQSLTKSS